MYKKEKNQLRNQIYKYLDDKYSIQTNTDKGFKRLLKTLGRDFEKEAIDKHEKPKKKEKPDLRQQIDDPGRTRVWRADED